MYYDNILIDIKRGDTSELYQKYKITVNADGTVYDNTSKIIFNNLIEWCTLKQNRASITNDYRTADLQFLSRFNVEGN